MAASIHSATSSSSTYYVQKAYLAPNEVRTRLIEHDIIPSSDQARENFFALGKDWWMCIIDGKYHSYGSEVFDLGLHGGDREPGYLEGIRKGCDFLMGSLDCDLSWDLYAEIHFRACEHFQNQPGDGTLCKGDTVKEYRKKGMSCFSSFSNAGLEKLEEYRISCQMLQEDWDFLFLQKMNDSRRKPGDESQRTVSDQAYIDQIKEKYFPGRNEQMSIDVMMTGFINPLNSARRQLKNEVKGYEEKLNESMKAFAERCDLTKELVSCLTTEEGEIYVFYHVMPDPRIFNDLTCKFIQKFNDQLHALQQKTYLQIEREGIRGIEEIKFEYRDAALTLIAQLYAELEWTHPWIDGQGRTDLILLNGLLTREGMHPVILNHPFFSTFHTLDEWIAYLKEGLVAYENLISIKAGK